MAFFPRDLLRELPLGHAVLAPPSRAPVSCRFSGRVFARLLSSSTRGFALPPLVGLRPLGSPHSARPAQCRRRPHPPYGFLPSLKGEIMAFFPRDSFPELPAAHAVPAQPSGAPVAGRFFGPLLRALYAPNLALLLSLLFRGPAAAGVTSTPGPGPVTTTASPTSRVPPFRFRGISLDRGGPFQDENQSR